jgi:hypothetical protein
VENERPAIAGLFEVDLTGQLSNLSDPLRELLAVT